RRTAVRRRPRDARRIGHAREQGRIAVRSHRRRGGGTRPRVPRPDRRHDDRRLGEETACGLGRRRKECEMSDAEVTWAIEPVCFGEFPALEQSAFTYMRGFGE